MKILKNGNLNLDVKEDWLYNLDTRYSSSYKVGQARIETNEKVLQILDKENNEITNSEKEILSHYSGTGGLSLNNRESLTQFFTSYKIINMIWQKIEKLGFSLDGNIKALEPSVGIGNFIGLGPKNIQWDAIDIDPICSKITKILYPSTNVYNKSFEEHYLNNEYDLVLSNVPFLDSRGAGIVKDKPHIRKLHEYFVLAALDKAKPNGVVALIVPSSIMDSINKKVREEINSLAEFICSYRLPVSSFEKVGAEVGTDIIFLRKRITNSVDMYTEFEKNLQFLDVGFPKEFSKASRQVQLNKYYMENPNNVLGHLSEEKNRYGDYVLKTKGALFNEDIDKILNDGTVYIPSVAAQNVIDNQEEVIDFKSKEYDTTPVGGLFNKDGKWYVRSAIKKSGFINEKGIPITVSKHIEPNIRIILQISELSRQLREIARSGDTYKVRVLTYKLKDKVDELKSDKPFLFYDSTLSKIMATDPRYSIVKVLFNDPDIFKLDTLNTSKYKIPLDDNTNIEEVARYLLLKDRKIIVENFAKIYKGGISECEALNILNNSDDFFKTPSTAFIEVHDDTGHINVIEKKVPVTYQLATDYLSGNIYKKIELAEREVTKGNLEYKRNIDALKKSIPNERTINDIRASVRHKWIDVSVVEDFVKNGLGYEAGIDYDDIARQYIVRFVDNWTTKYELKKKLTIGEKTFPYWFEKYLNGKEIIVSDADGKKDKIASAKLSKKMAIVDELFNNYLRRNPEIAEPLMQKYNYLFNNWKSKDYLNMKIIIPNTHPDWKFRKNQLEFANMALSLGSAICAQRVGAGKTAINALVNHMLKVSGRAKKPMCIVPGKVLKKFARDITEGSRGLPPIFPDMNILDVTEYDFNEAMAMAAFNDYDLILIPDTWMKRIAISPKRELRYIKEELNNLLVSESRRAKQRGNKRSKWDFKKRKMALESKIAELRNYVKRDGIYFEDLGVDAISLDEAQSVKNLVTSVRGSQLGLSATPSQIAIDFNLKAQYIMEKNNGHNVFLYTATPVSNSVLEIYGLLKNVAPYEWIERSILSADDFIDFYANTSLTIGVNKENEVGPVTKISGFINIDELRALFKKYVDYRPFMKDIKLPEVEEVTLTTDMTINQRKYFNHLLERLKNMKSDKTEDNVLKVLIEGRMCSIGEPLVYNCLPQHTNSPKIDKCINIVANIYKNFQGNQVIFLDQYGGTLLSNNDMHQFIKNQLITKGVSPNEIIIVNGSVNSDREKKLEIQDAFNDGKYRVIIGTSDSIGAGMDLQERTIATHNLDIPWTPTGIQQRLGRMWRPGNPYARILNINYFTRGSYDAWSASIVAIKKKWQDELLLGGIQSQGGYIKNEANTVWNIDSIMAEIMEDPVEKEKLNFNAEKSSFLSQLKSLKERNKNLISEIDEVVESISRRERKIEDYKKDLKNGVKIKLCTLRIKQLSKTIDTLKKQLETLSEAKEKNEITVKKISQKLKSLEGSYSERIKKAKNIPQKVAIEVDIDSIIEQLKKDNKDIVFENNSEYNTLFDIKNSDTCSNDDRKSISNINSNIQPTFIRIEAKKIKKRGKKQSTVINQYVFDLNSFLN